MKTMRISLFLVLSLFISTQTFANTMPEDFNKQQLRRQVSRMIDAPKLSELGITKTYVFVNFEINKDNEIVVIEVVADDERLSRHVFESLNKRKVNTNGLTPDAAYNLKIAFQKENA